MTPHLTPTVPDRTGNSLGIVLENARHWTFTGKFDKRGKMEGSVSALKVFTPQSPDQLGVFPDALGAVGTGFGSESGQDGKVATALAQRILSPAVLKP